MGVLDVIDIQHGVVAHLQREIELFQLLPGGGVRCLRRVQRAHLMAQRRSVDLHEDQAEPVRHILHERGFAVAGRRDHHQQTHQVAALVLTHRAHLLGQVVADHAQVDVVDQLVAYERGQWACLELREAQGIAFSRDDALAHALVGVESRHELLQVGTQAGQEVIQRQRKVALRDARVLAEQSLHLDLQRHLAGTGAQRTRHQQQRRRFFGIAGMRGERGQLAQGAQPLTGQCPASSQPVLLALQRAFEGFALARRLQMLVQRLKQCLRVAAGAENRVAGTEFGGEIGGCRL